MANPGEPNVYEWDEIIKRIWESSNPAWSREKKALFIACANYLSSNDITATWKKALWWYGCLIISPGPFVWPVIEGQLSICINTVNYSDDIDYDSEDSDFMEAILLEYFNTEVKTAPLTLNNYQSELDKLIESICNTMNLKNG